MPVLHDQDFYAWTQEQIQLFKSGQLDQLDVPYLIEELHRMGASEKRELTRCLEVLLTHLLKWQYQPSHQNRNWSLTIKEQRFHLEDHLQENPSLKKPDALQGCLMKAYRRALVQVEKETGLACTTFPPTCPFSLEQIMSHSFYPG